MIIVTGADNTGKTCLINHLRDTFNMPVAARFQPLPPVNPVDWERWYHYNKAEFLKDQDISYDLIYDRLYVDELVYGPVCRDGFVIGYSRMLELYTLMKETNPVIIFAHTSMPNIAKDWGDRYQNFSLSSMARIQHQYFNVMEDLKRGGLTVIDFDYITDGDYKQLDKNLKEVLNERKQL